ncbi:50S ribosomal protein L21 [Desulfatiglans anilini]|uniref:50S ribosomal protein L21 n=1 Tax=Desulfatiglans anilini TaxID=90728 RepID=UPI00041E6A90|nr:50S ribosomal protein L21 [Desulfatiglans anilini]
MYAVIKTGGKQYKVAAGDELRCEKLPGAVGDTVVFEDVLLRADGDAVVLGQPVVENAKVIGRIKGQGQAKKILVFKYKRRKNIRKLRGHRQAFSLVRIESIE